MKKYKQCVQINDKITDIMELPCVVGVRKEERRAMIIGGAEEFTSTQLVYELTDGSNVYAGYWLCLDVCGHWNVLSDREYLLHKDDEI